MVTINIWRTLGRFSRVTGALSKLLYRITLGQLILERGVRFIGVPIISVVPKGEITLEENVLLLSASPSYHASIYSRTKLLADRAGAKIKVGRNTRLNGCCIHAWQEIRIGENCLVAANVTILDANGHALCFDDPCARLTTRDTPRPVNIEDNVWIGLGAIILPGTTIGAGSIIGANCIVSGNIPPNSIVTCSPALIKEARILDVGTVP